MVNSSLIQMLRTVPSRIYNLLSLGLLDFSFSPPLSLVFVSFIVFHIKPVQFNSELCMI